MPACAWEYVKGLRQQKYVPTAISGHKTKTTEKQIQSPELCVDDQNEPEGLSIEQGLMRQPQRTNFRLLIRAVEILLVVCFSVL